MQVLAVLAIAFSFYFGEYIPETWIFIAFSELWCMVHYIKNGEDTNDQS